MRRKEILDTATKYVVQSREEDYGSPEGNFKLIAQLWQSYLSAGNNLAPELEIYIGSKDVAAMLALLKIARIATGSGKVDNWIDLAGYAACGGEIETMGK